MLTDPGTPVQSPHALIFYHVPKCGGTTLRNFFSINYGSHYHSMIRDFQWLDFAENVNKNRQDDICVAGHYCWGADELIQNRHIYYITFLRDPFSRLVSAFRYANLAHVDYHLDFETFIKTNVNFYVNLLGNGSLRAAEACLDEKFYFVGILEEFNKSMAFVADRFGLDRLYFDRLKVSRKIDTVNEEDFKDRFNASNEKDILLYRHALRLFQEKTAECATPSPDSVPQKIVINERKREDLSFANRAYPEVLDLIERKNLTLGDIQGLATIYQKEGAHHKALDLFDRYMPLTRMCLWRAELIAKVDRKKAMPFLLDAAKRYGAIQSDRDDSSINGFRQTLLDRILAFLYRYSRLPGKGIYHVYKHVVFRMVRKGARGFTEYYNTCLRILSITYQLLVKLKLA